MRLLLAILLAALCAGLARADEVEVVPLKYRTAEELVPILRPLLEPGGGLSGMQSTLVIRASRANIAQFKQVLATLDAMPRRLLISVRQEAAGSFEQRGAGLSGTAGGGEVRVGVNEPPRPQSSATVFAYDSRGSAGDRMTSQVQALEGSPAYIATGQSVPVRTTVVTRTPGDSVGQSTATDQDVASGFHVIPRVSGDRVFLDIAPQRATPGEQGPGSANVQQISTTASGRLAEWFQLGGIDQGATRSQSGVFSGANGARTGASGVWVRIDEIR
jgi:hypothetical protein